WPHNRPTIYPAKITRIGSVGLLLGCIGEAFTSRINDATIEVLTRLGYDVHMLPSITCCGALGLHAGFREQSLTLAKHLIDSALAENVDFYISNIAGC